MAVYKFEDIAFNSTEKKKPVEEDKHTYLGLEHLDSDSIYVTRFGADVAPKGEKLLMKKVMFYLERDERIKKRLR